MCFAKPTSPFLLFFAKYWRQSSHFFPEPNTKLICAFSTNVCSNGQVSCFAMRQCCNNCGKCVFPVRGLCGSKTLCRRPFVLPKA